MRNKSVVDSDLKRIVLQDATDSAKAAQLLAYMQQRVRLPYDAEEFNIAILVARDMLPKPCANCGEIFAPVREGQMFCKRNCADAHRQRRRRALKKEGANA